MATVRERVLQLRALGYAPAEICKEMESEGRKTTKTYVNHVLASVASESQHYRRTELCYEMLCNLTARIEMLTQVMDPRTVRNAMDRLEVYRHPPTESSPLPPTEPGE